MVMQMSRLADFQRRSVLITYLAKQLKNGRIALVLGSGISKPFGLPTWHELLVRLYARKGVVPSPTLDLKRQAQDFRLQFFPTDKRGFIAEVKAALYDGVSVDFEQLRKSKTLSALGALVMASHRGNASKVITFNWDNLLELYLEYHGFKTLSASDEIHWAGNVDVTILHPHGFIPFASSATGSDDIVFDQSSYSAVIGQEHRPWRQEILSIFRSHTVLFVGLSGRDDNLDSFLHIAKQEHASLAEQSLFWGVTIDVLSQDSDRRLWQANGVFFMDVANYDDELPEVLFKICQEAARV
jgi:hypothetical protein